MDGMAIAQPARRLGFYAAVAAALFVLFSQLPWRQWALGGREALIALGPAGALLYVGAYVAAAVCFVPGSAITFIGGAVFGPWVGLALVSLASTLGAGCAFLVGRYLARPAVEQWCAANPRLASLDRVVETSGWRIVALTRLSPAFPYNLLNYAFGLTRIGLGPYLLASWVGMLPGTALYVFGSAAAFDLATAGARPGAGPNWGLYLAVAGTLAVTVYVTRLAREALGRSQEAG